ncbi:hypothetical protein JXB37_02040 [candidate division WOR-3 bacterium]|nr:hypothetical protein [candidate division WOR-3 bacterium]
MTRYPSSKPWTRWWWFNTRMTDEGMRGQLDWLRAAGFGGVELAFVYPLPDRDRGPKWLSREWSELVASAKRHCDALGLGCDFTFGTLWPFGDSRVSRRDSSRTFNGPSLQRLRRTWEAPREGRVLDHLSPGALDRYCRRVGKALAPALKGARSGLFCDSWEVETPGLWSRDFGRVFRKRFGYDIRPFTDTLDHRPHERYDYRKLLSTLVIERFFKGFTAHCRKLGAFSRVQCHGAPCDIVAAYAAVDVPETEALLFDPGFARIAASAAALQGTGPVSCEAFTCLYGWKPWPGPGPHQGEEQIADLKLLADALLAGGVNHLVWHGTPWSPPGSDNRFYASVHAAPGGALEPHIPAFNAWLERCCGLLRQGETRSDVAALLPLEDAWMLGELPEERRKPSARFHWELHDARPAAELKPWNPLWVTLPFLRRVRYEDRRLACGAARFRVLHVDSEWLDLEALMEILRLARQGLPVCLKRRPRQPGRRQDPQYPDLLRELCSLPNVRDRFCDLAPGPGIVTGEDVPGWWCRRAGDEHLLFFAHPSTRGLTYPMKYGQSSDAIAAERPVTLNLGSAPTELLLRFPARGSLAFRVSASGAAEPIDLGYIPPPPTTGSQTADG